MRETHRAEKIEGKMTPRFPQNPCRKAVEINDSLKHKARQKLGHQMEVLEPRFLFLSFTFQYLQLPSQRQDHTMLSREWHRIIYATYDFQNPYGEPE